MWFNIAIKGQIVNLLVQLEACKAGMGISILPCFLGTGEPSLTRLSEPKPDPKFELWLLTHKDVRTNMRIRVFSDFIISAIKSERSRLTGQI
ncbi:MAG: hypothetical protein COB24_03175 [Hyphomicrobiales bacterium]|nr:MAG: hypothetical protein COB24_03175 [Hyphomicrobiales bacterium]